MNWIKWLIAPALPFALLGALATAQNSPELKARPRETQEAPKFLITARNVVLDVVVTDKAGNVVNSLTSDNFTVLEDETPQNILSFEAPAQHVLPSDISIESTVELEQRAPNMPVDVIVLDELNTQFEEMAYARYAINTSTHNRGG